MVCALSLAVVGHVGCGTSEIAESLRESLEEKTLPGGAFEVQILKARDVITDWARENAEALHAVFGGGVGAALGNAAVGPGLHEAPRRSHRRAVLAHAPLRAHHLLAEFSPGQDDRPGVRGLSGEPDRKSTRLNSSHRCISYA